MGKFDKLNNLIDELNIYIQFIENPRVLEIGCGEGDISILLCKVKEWLIFGQDSNIMNIRQAKMKSIIDKVDHLCNFFYSSSNLLQWRNDYMDAVYIINESIVNDENTRKFTMGEIYRVLKPGGRCIVWHSNLPLGWHNSSFKLCDQGLKSLFIDIGFKGVKIVDISEGVTKKLKDEWESNKYSDAELFSKIEHIASGNLFGAYVVGTKPS